VPLTSGAAVPLPIHRVAPRKGYLAGGDYSWLLGVGRMDVLPSATDTGARAVDEQWETVRTDESVAQRPLRRPGILTRCESPPWQPECRQPVDVGRQRNEDGAQPDRGWWPLASHGCLTQRLSAAEASPSPAEARVRIPGRALAVLVVGHGGDTVRAAERDDTQLVVAILVRGALAVFLLPGNVALFTYAERHGARDQLPPAARASGSTLG